MTRIPGRLAALLVALPLAVGACEPGISGLPEGEAAFSIVIAPEISTAAASGLMASTSGATAGVRISMASVESIVLPIGAVEALSTDGGWHAAGVIDREVDLLDLPEGGLELLDSSVPEGDYLALRFWLTEGASITLAESVRAGRSTLEAGTYPLEIPSADVNGVRFHADFEVTAAGEVLTVLVDGDATIRNVMATGGGVLKMAPVLSVRNGQGQRVGGVDTGQRTGPYGPGQGGGPGPNGHGQYGPETEGRVASVEVGAGTFTLEDGTVVRVTESTYIAGDFLSLVDVAAAIGAEEVVEAEVHGPLDDDGVTIVAHRVEFEVEDDDGDGESGDPDDGEAEIRGPITSADRDAVSFTVLHRGTTYTVETDDDTDFDFDTPYASWDDVVDAVEAGETVRVHAEGEWVEDLRLLAWEVELGPGQMGTGGPGGPGGPGPGPGGS